MYLARERRPGGTFHYYIRESVRAPDGRWVSRDLFDLGEDPGRFIVYTGAYGFYVDPGVTEALAALGVHPRDEELEEVFEVFIDPVVRRAVAHFTGRRRSGGRAPRPSEAELAAAQARIHPFDRRRLCFLKFGRIDMEALLRRPMAFYNFLLEKSRDEIEQRLDRMEAELRPWELKDYLYAVMDLPARFAPRPTRFVPGAQDPALMDRYVLEAICRLAEEPALRDPADSTPAGRLPPFLLKYLVLWFDVAYATPRGGAPAGGAPARDEAGAALAVFGLDRERFEAMTAREFSRLFRQKARAAHPDTGGAHEAFIRLRKAFLLLRRLRGWTGS
ncbi:hypothetical protein G3N55_00685 [Dissulfurirhabdus thermomarina]|uniref:J domain-containing protein n=1 Tax=Dissulfurirhabdus thermomarina TaxID=1765737 RepID=A0A6N9TPK0_DISTH|nr:hypothetical protein [Dissulfurirhabdus thermomarina]NDY41367.1 hypothetical protein [Dissulfurirhabdus thermomarina]NMX23617.1 hypothetical protein [Dissulfurirhabdus thermomarina]